MANSKLINFDPYLIPKYPLVFEEEIKKSLFITYLAHTPSIQEAKAFVDQIKNRHADARHNCWAYVAGRPEDSMKWGFSDDGEPSGTAGKPMLAQLSGSNIGEITTVVTRYFGGVKLGTGGLVKAYGGGVQQALKQLETVKKKITNQLVIRLEYSFLPTLQSIMTQYDAKETESEYSENVMLVVELEVNHIDSFTQTIINRSGAKVIVSPLNIKKSQ